MAEKHSGLRTVPLLWPDPHSSSHLLTLLRLTQRQLTSTVAD